MKPYEVNTPFNVNFNVKDSLFGLSPENRIYGVLYLISKDHLKTILQYKSGCFHRSQLQVNLETHTTPSDDIYVS